MAQNKSKDDDQKSDVKSGSVKVENDITRAGRDKTEVRTETKVEDRTEEPARHMVTSYKVSQRKHGNGTVETIYGEAKARK